MSRVIALRNADAATLESAFADGRRQLLALFDGFERALGPAGLQIAFDPVVNLPLWELGHIGWFEEHWIVRNAMRSHGVALDASLPGAFPPSAFLVDADTLYDSSAVAHATRWQLALPSPDATRRYLAQVRERTIGLLRDAADAEPAHADDTLYFFRLALFHEDMHREAWHAVAQHLGIDLGHASATPVPPSEAPAGEWTVPAHVHAPTPADAPGFAFDNERGAEPIALAAFTIDRAAVTWRRFLPFVAAGGYASPAFWSEAGRQWLHGSTRTHPAHLRHNAKGWQSQRFGRWQAVDLDACAVHLTAHEAEAWCCWADRRLPTETEWEAAALLAAEVGEAFAWGDVWEWTASPFAPHAGFLPHPYRDYSAPWFDGRPVLRGGSFATAPHLKHPRYRNFFPADRNDVFAGFRSCAMS